ncbi:MAG TPA: AI-2E family transporter [Dactylosporangium sp.]|jgi:predicted PurR-regulated permease PerM|nr:AI-2E family transporter [Dactylosporangium sp.]
MDDAETQQSAPSAGTVATVEAPPSARRRGLPFRRSHPYYIGFVGGLGVIVCYYLAESLLAVTTELILILIALLIAVGLNPLVERLTARGMRRGLAVLIVAGGGLLLLAAFITAIAQPLATQTSGLIGSMPQRLETLERNRTIANLDQRYNVVGRLQSMFSGADTAQVIAGSILGFGEFLVTSIFETFTVIVMTVYFLGSLPAIRTSTLRFVPASRRSRVALLSEGVLDRMGGYVSGAATVAALAGLAAFLMLGVLQVEFLLPLALLIALTDLIPLVGATIGALLVTIVVFLDSPVKAVAAGLFFIVYQQFENFLIYPRVMSRSVDVPPMVAVIAALIGAALLGVVGALLAIPLAAGAIYLFREVVQPRQDAM